MSFAFLNLEMYRHESINFNFEWPAVILLHIIISGKRVWIILSLNPGGGGGGGLSLIGRICTMYIHIFTVRVQNFKLSQE